jgi:hypothetical protein
MLSPTEHTHKKEGGANVCCCGKTATNGQDTVVLIGVGATTYPMCDVSHFPGAVFLMYV